MGSRLLALALGCACAAGAVLLVLRLLPAPEDVRLTTLSSRFFERSDSSAEPSEFPQPNAPTLRRRALSPDELADLQPPSPDNQPDPSAVTVYRPYLDHRRNWAEHPDGGYRMRTNGLGLRDDDDPQLEQPVKRVLIFGDSHADGVFESARHFGQELERRLRRDPRAADSEFINAGHGGQSFFHYLGALERLSWLRPDACIVLVYGGNDFDDVLTLQHRFAGTRRPAGMSVYGKLFDAAKAVSLPALSQCFVALKYFAFHPDQADIALDAACAVSSEIMAHCERLGAKALFVYLPPLLDAQAELLELPVAKLAEILELKETDLSIHNRMADRYLEGLRAMGAEFVDLRPRFAAATEPLYWARDHHINIAAQQLIADELQGWVERVLLDGRAPRPVESRPLLASGGPGREHVLALFERLGGRPPPDGAPVPDGVQAVRFQNEDVRPHALSRAPAGAAEAPRAVLIRDADLARDADGHDFFARVAAECASRGVPTDRLRDAPAAGATLNSACATLDSVLALRPELVLLAFDEESDWAELTRAPKSDLLGAAARFKRRDAAKTVRMACEALLDLHTRCESAGAKLIVVRAPSALTVGASGARSRAAPELARRGLEPADIANVELATNGLLTALHSAGVETLDLRALLNSAPRGGFEASGRLTSYGQELAAALLAIRIARPAPAKN